MSTRAPRPHLAADPEAHDAPLVTRRVLVTGGAGFVGHHLVRELDTEGNAVLVLDDLSTGLAEHIPPHVRLERVDINSPAATRSVLRWRPEVVFHLAAQTSVPESMRDPMRDLATNGRGTFEMLRSAQDSGARRFVFVSSGGGVYGECRKPATENARTRPASFYGLHKLLAEDYVRASRLPFAIARPSNIFGAGQVVGGDGAVIPAFVSAIQQGGPISIDGDGSQTRDFVHVTDVVRALILLSNAPESGTWNVSSGRSVSIRRLARLFEQVIGRRLMRTQRPARPGDVRDSRIGSERLRTLGWEPTMRLEDGVRLLLESDEVLSSSG